MIQPVKNKDALLIKDRAPATVAVATGAAWVAGKSAAFGPVMALATVVAIVTCATAVGELCLVAGGSNDVTIAAVCDIARVLCFTAASPRLIERLLLQTYRSCNTSSVAKNKVVLFLANLPLLSLPFLLRPLLPPPMLLQLLAA